MSEELREAIANVEWNPSWTLPDRIIAAIEAVGYACVKPDPPGSVIANVHARGYAAGFAKAIEIAAYLAHRKDQYELAARISALTPPKEGE